MAVLANYYEILGVARNANPAEIRHAYNRWVGDFKKETTPPDPRREALLQEAYEVLSDPQRREAHDAELRQSQPPRKKAVVPVAAIAGAALVVLAAGGAYFGIRGSGSSAPKARSEEQIQLAMSGSVSRLMVYDISGKAAPAGMAFVIEDKVMVANCVALPPGSQLMVQTGTRQVSARITAADPALGLCKLHTDGYVGEPLAVNSAGPAAGSRVYAGSYGAKGEVKLKEAAVGKVVDEPQGKAIQATGAAPEAGTHGAPLLDAQGKVVAVATLQPDGTMLHRVVPAQWLAENRPRVEEPKPYQGGGAAGATASSGSSGSRATVASGSGASTGGTYAPPLENTDYGCDCDFTKDKDFVAEREEKWKKIAELPPAERERAAKAQRMAEEYTRKTMKDMNERLRRSGVD